MNKKWIIRKWFIETTLWEPGEVFASTVWIDLLMERGLITSACRVAS